MRWVFIWVLVMLPFAAQAEPGTMCSEGRFGHAFCVRPSHFAFDLCHTLQGEAQRHGLDPGFLTRLIWQESRFDPNAVSHANARGIAQFIDSTAQLRGLRDQFNPAEALEASAQYLAFLTQEFGNHGLAAVAYNGGEARAARFLARQGGLPRETRDYVRIITGLTAETWRDTPPRTHDYRLDKDKRFIAACLDLAQRRRLTALAAPPQALRPWGVHLAFGNSQRRAKQALFRNTRQCRSLMSGERIEYMQSKRRAGNGRPYIIARIGRNTRRSALNACLKLTRSGCRCRVYRTRP